MNPNEFLSGILDNIHEIKWKSSIPPVSRSYFKNAEVFLEEHRLATLKAGEHSDYFSDVQFSDLDAPLDVCVVSGTRGFPGFGFARFKQLAANEVRGRVKRLMPYMVEYSKAYVDLSAKNLETRAVQVIYGSVEGKDKWIRIDANNTVEIVSNDDSVAASKIAIARGVQFTRRYQWFITFQYEGPPSIMIPTTPHGVRDAFRKKRSGGRIHHWVSQHYRLVNKREEDALSLVLVRQHLKGRLFFEWEGFKCSVVPSRFDVDLNKRLEYERELIRKAEKSGAPLDTSTFLTKV